MLSRNFTNDSISLDCDCADVVRYVEYDADNLLEDAVPWEYAEHEDDPE